MASPFPGMDPYLEDPRGWRDFHLRLLAETSAALQADVRPRYLVRVEEDVFLCPAEDPAAKLLLPDVAVLRRKAERSRERQARRTGASSTITAPVLVAMVPDEIKERRLVVLRRSDRKLVTVIELLSPTNKTSGARSRDAYLTKRDEILASPVHLVEIDLLRAGHRFPSVWPLPTADYYVHVSRAEKRPMGEVWPIGLRQKLPTIPIPLAAPDPDAGLDLGSVLRRAYDRADYGLEIDYRAAPPGPRLSAADRAWARKRVRGHEPG